jgi:CBS domain-containing membrane protein
MSLTLVKDVMTEIVETLQVGDTIARASRQMKAGRIRHLPIVDHDEHLVGLLTHRQILGAWLSHGDPNQEPPGRVAEEVPVEAMMERNVLTVTPDSTAALAAALLESSKFGCLPVVEGGKLVGIVTEADFVTFARKHLEAETETKACARACSRLAR